MESQNEIKAKEFATTEDGNMVSFAYIAAMRMAQWKDEQFAKEKQTLIQKYEDKLNKLNQREEVIRDNVRRANSRYGFEGLF